MSRSHLGRGSSRSSFSSSRSGSSRSHLSRSVKISRHHNSSYHHHGGHHHSTHIFVGGSGEPRTEKSAVVGLIGFFLFLAIIACISCSLINSGAKSDLEEVKKCYNYYQNMIAYADENPEYQTTGKITKIAFDSKFKMYYIEYVVNTIVTHNGKPKIINHRNTSFAMYTIEQSTALYRGMEIKIAFDTPITLISDLTDSINMDYKNVSLYEDAEYKSVKNTIKLTNIAKVVAGIVAGGLLVVLIVVATKSKKDNNEELDSSTNTNYNPINTSNNTTPTTKTTYCAYCGSAIPSGSNKCPGCGANQKKY